MNVELLRVVRDAIANVKEGEGTQFNMRYVFVRTTLENEDSEEYRTRWPLEEIPTAFGECGTAACIAGFTLALAGETTNNWMRAQELLGLSSRDAVYLFYGQWHTLAKKSKSEADIEYSKDIPREDAIAYLDRCIAAGKIVHV